MTLAEFLLARIAEDEDTIRTVTNNGQIPAAGGVIAESLGDPWSTGRLLAECDVKRRIVELHQNGFPGIDYCTVCHDDSLHDAASWPCATLRALALPYADYPDYRPEWAA